MFVEAAVVAFFVESEVLVSCFTWAVMRESAFAAGFGFASCWKSLAEAFGDDCDTFPVSNRSKTLDVVGLVGVTVGDSLAVVFAGSV